MLNKSALIPLIKRVHPDLYLKYGGEVVESNKRFVQSLYELSEFLRGVENKDLRRRLSPLKAFYSLDFFLKDRETDEIVETKVGISPNHALCEQSFLINKKLDLAVADLKTQVGNVYVLAGLLNPFRRKQNFGKIPSGGEDDMDLADTDRIIYERYMDKRRNTHSMGTSSRASSRLEQEADDFIRGGGVLFQRMSPPDEAQALNKVRNFLVEYGTVLNVGRSSRWNSIHLVITDKTEKQGEGESYKIRFPGSSKRAVVEVPKDFRDDKLLQLLAEAAVKTQESNNK